MSTPLAQQEAGSSPSEAPSRAHVDEPAVPNSRLLIEAADVSVQYAVKRPAFWTLRRDTLHALRSVSVALRRGEVLGIVGESGSGKSTLGRVLAGIERPHGGSVRFAPHCHVQTIYQDASSALNPFMTVRASLLEGLKARRRSALTYRGAVLDNEQALLGCVGLDEELATRKPHALSGGQKQRVAIARALAAAPDALIADEPISALDVSIQAHIINLLGDISEHLGIAVAFIAHDLGVVRHLCERTIVLYLGQIVEEGPTADLFARPAHPYTRALIAAAPSVNQARPVSAPPTPDGTPPASLELPTPVGVPMGCAYRGRCPAADPQRCLRDAPELKAQDRGSPSVNPETVQAYRCHYTPGEQSERAARSSGVAS